MHQSLLIFSLFFLSTLAWPHNHPELRVLWNSWKELHSKSYTLEEDAARFAIFMENYKKIQSFNAENASPKLGLTVFADLTNEEFRQTRAGSASKTSNVPINTEEFDSYVVKDLPSSVDWRKKKAVTPVAMEGQCGACWAFSVTGVLEGLHAIKLNRLTSFSAQQILDCLTSQYACSGGELDAGFEYAIQYGLEPTNDYPYTGVDQSCNYQQNLAVKIATDYIAVPPNNATALKAAIATMPTAILVDESSDVFQFYHSGVISANCTDSAIDHSALAVGYEVVDGVEAYIVKDVFGTSWGVHGYLYISTDPTPNNGAGVCGILTQSYLAK